MLSLTLLRKLFQGIYNTCLLSFAEEVLLQESFFMYCSILIKLHLYKRSHKYKKNEPFRSSLSDIHAEKLKGNSGRKKSLAQMKEREKCKNMSHH